MSLLSPSSSNFFPCLLPLGRRFFTLSALHKQQITNDRRRKQLAKKEEITDSLTYCLDLIRSRDYEQYLAVLRAPVEVRPRIIASLAFNVEVSTIRQKIKRNSGVTGIYQLQFWNDALNVLFADGKGPVPKQPAVTCLRAFGSPTDLPLYQRLIAARQETLGDRPFPTTADALANAEAVHGTVIQLFGNALGDQEPENDQNASFIQAANEMGKAVGISTLAKATIPLLLEGVVLLPADLLAIHGLSIDDVFSNNMPDKLKGVISDLITVAVSHAEKSRALKSDIPRTKKLALIAPGFKVDTTAQILRGNGFNLLQKRLHEPHPLTAWYLWWRSVRGYY